MADDIISQLGKVSRQQRRRFYQVHKKALKMDREEFEAAIKRHKEKKDKK
jgi:hypothetical protein